MSKYTLQIRSEPSAVPSEIRLRRMLKQMLRTFNFRCMSIQATPEAPPPTIDPENAGKRASVAATRKEGAE